MVQYHIIMALLKSKLGSLIGIPTDHDPWCMIDFGKAFCSSLDYVQSTFKRPPNRLSKSNPHCSIQNTIITLDAK